MNETRALAAADELPFGERLLRIYHAPRRTFAAIPDGGSWPDWILPVLLAGLFWAAHNGAILSVVAPESASQLPGWEQMNQEQQAQAERSLAEWRQHGWFSMPLVGSLSSLALTGLVLLGVAKWVVRADINLRQALALKAYAGLVTIPQWILLTPLVRAHGPGAASGTFSPGVLLPAPMLSTPVGRLLSGINLFDLWQTVVIGIGLSAMSGQPARRCVGILAGLWLVWVALGALVPVPAPPPPPPAP